MKSKSIDLQTELASKEVDLTNINDQLVVLRGTNNEQGTQLQNQKLKLESQISELTQEQDTKKRLQQELLQLQT